MTFGKQAGEYSFKSTSATITPGPAGSVLSQVNFEGTATGFGAVIGTATFVGGKSGTFSWCAQGYPDNADSVTGIGQGTFESVARNKWSTSVISQISDGRAVGAKGEIDLATRSWTGTLYEVS
jgi:hypothetical protein